MGSGASAPAALVADDAQMQAIAEKTGLPVEDIKVMGEQFKALDTNNSGSVSLSELHRDHASRTFLWQFDREAFKSACVELLDAETDDDGERERARDKREAIERAARERAIDTLPPPLFPAATRPPLSSPTTRARSWL